MKGSMTAGKRGRIQVKGGKKNSSVGSPVSHLERSGSCGRQIRFASAKQAWFGPPMDRRSPDLPILLRFNGLRIHYWEQ